MSRQNLHELLGQHRPASEKERADLERMKAWLRELEEPLSRGQPKAHFTGSAVVVDPEGERLVLVHHGKLRRWLQPGGHVDAADWGRLEATAVREAQEETGMRVRPHPHAPRPLDVDIHPIPSRGQELGHLHLDVRFLLVAENPEALRHDPSESLGAQWLGWEEALARVDEAPLRRMLSKARAVVRPSRLLVAL